MTRIEYNKKQILVDKSQYIVYANNIAKRFFVW
jgi:hypothetical protein